MKFSSPLRRRSSMIGDRAHATRRDDRRARRLAIVGLAAVLALESADAATVGTSSTQLQAGLGIDRTGIGLLLTVSSLVGALAALPAGVLIDRVNRIRLLSVAVLLWGVASAVSAFATGFFFLVVARTALGVVTAVAGPAVAALTGDMFDAAERGRVYGLILSGELVGAGVGFLVAGQFAALSWRAPFLALAVPSLLVWWALRHVREPARGGKDQFTPRQTDQPDSGQDQDIVRRLAAQQHVTPHHNSQSLPDPDNVGLAAAARYVLRIPSNVVLIIASAFGYFFFSGLRGFVVEFAKEHYGVGQALATSLVVVVGAGALVGVVLGGRLADRLLARGRLAARVDVAGTSVLLCTVLLIPALLLSGLWAALPLLLAASAFLGATNPPLDSARLDVVHPLLWGRAESIRTLLRSTAVAVAPVTFGYLSESVFTGGDGLDDTFLVMLAALAIAGVISLVFGRRYYPGDVAAVATMVEGPPTEPTAGRPS